MRGRAGLVRWLAPLARPSPACPNPCPASSTPSGCRIASALGWRRAQYKHAAVKALAASEALVAIVLGLAVDGLSAFSPNSASAAS